MQYIADADEAKKIDGVSIYKIGIPSFVLMERASLSVAECVCTFAKKEIDRILVDIGHHLVGDALHARLGVTHGRRRVAVHRTEVTLAVDERITHRPLLGQTHHGVVDRTVAVGVELTEHVADDTGRLTRRLVVRQPELGAHIVEDAPVHGLQTVAHVGQGTGDDDRHRIVDVGRLHLLLDVDGDDAPHQPGILFFFSQHFGFWNFIVFNEQKYDLFSF